MIGFETAGLAERPTEPAQGYRHCVNVLTPTFERFSQWFDLNKCEE